MAIGGAQPDKEVAAIADKASGPGLANLPDPGDIGYGRHDLVADRRLHAQLVEACWASLTTSRASEVPEDSGPGDFEVGQRRSIHVQGK
jgi:hypothetical protein